MSKNQRIGAETGSSLIEVLIAMAIFSFGVLSLVSMQGSAVRTITDAKLRTDANQLAADALTMLWGASKKVPDFAHYQDSPKPDDPCETSGEPSKLAAEEGSPMYEWLDRVSKKLPAEQKQQIKVVTVDGNSTVAVTLCWRRTQSKDWDFVQLNSLIAANN